MSTTIKIGHASMSESGTAVGIAGDSTGKEVYIVSKYTAANLSPYVVLRPTQAELASRSVAACIAGCENNCIGYSQSTRNTLYDQAQLVDFDLSNITVSCNTDCSAFMTVCAIAGGALIDYGSNAPTTSTMKDRFISRGSYELLTDSIYTTMTDYLKAGDILVSAAKGHTVMILEDGSASSDPEISYDLYFYNIISKLTNVKNTSCEVEITTINQTGDLGAGTPRDLLYYLEYKKLSDVAYTEQQIINKKLKLLNLDEDTCYIYRVKVKNIYGDLFCSAYKLFSTSKDQTRVSKLSTIPKNNLATTYINIESDYLPAVIYIKE